MKSKRAHWKITVAGWGVLWAKGTEDQAERWRQAKATWEHASAVKKEVRHSDLPEGEEWAHLSELID